MILKQKMKYFADNMDELFDKLLPADLFPSNKLLEAVRYSTIDGGKKLRSFLVYYIGKHLGIQDSILYHIGASIEYIHTYTLIHDDLPCMDNDDMRRNKLASHLQFGEDIAILAGDALQAEAFYVLSSEDLALSAEIKLEIINKVAEIIGGRNLVSGQLLDLEFVSNDSINSDVENIYKINVLKTARMISLCCLIPAIIAEKDLEYKTNLATYGEKIGIMYQIADDFNDYKIKQEPFNIVNLLGVDKAMSIINDINLSTKLIIKDINFNELEQINKLIMSSILHE